MDDKHFMVVLTGKLVDGAALSQVKANVAALFKVAPGKVEKLFGGRPVIVKKGLDEATANKYRLALQRAGAQCRVLARTPQGAQAPAAKPAPRAATGAPAQSPKPPVPHPTPGSEAGLQKSVVKPAPASLGALATTQLDEPGVVLVTHREEPVPEVDTSGLSMDEPGATLVEPETVPEPQVDLSRLSMDEPGVVLTEAEETAPLEVDLSALSLDAPGAVLVEHEPVPEPHIDTSKLGLSQ